MADDVTRQESFRLPVRVVEFVDGLAELGVYGTSKAEVYRHFVTEGVHRAITDDVVGKTLAAREVLASLKKNGKVS